MITSAGAPEDARKDATTVVLDHIDSKRLLLILDNCEQLLKACAAVVGKIRSVCAGVHLIITSREALRDDGDADRLFVDRPSAVAPGSSGRPARVIAGPPVARADCYNRSSKRGGPARRAEPRAPHSSQAR